MTEPTVDARPCAASTAAMEAWKAMPTKVRLERLKVREGVLTVLDRLVAESDRKETARKTECRVQLAVDCLTGARDGARAVLVLALDRDDISMHALHGYLVQRDLPDWAMPGPGDIADHRQKQCPCFRDPSAPRRTRLDDIESDIEALVTDNVVLRARLDTIAEWCAEDHKQAEGVRILLRCVGAALEAPGPLRRPTPPLLAQVLADRPAPTSEAQPAA